MKYLTLLILTFSLSGFSQDAQIKGAIFTSDSTETVPFTLIRLTSITDTLYTKSDIYGHYKFENLKTDSYDLKIENSLYGYKKVVNICLTSSDLIMNVYLQNLIITCCGGCYWPKPHIYPIGSESHVKITKKDILHLKSTEVTDHVILLSTDFNEIDEELFLRGTRSNNIIYYVDGFRQNNIPKLPRTAINSMYTCVGGLPAKFGDTTSGVISITTTSYFDLYYDWKSKQ